MLTHRENLEDIISPLLHKFLYSDIDMAEASTDIAVAVFDALRITNEEQTKTGGYFMLHAGKKKTGVNMVEDTGEFSSTVLTSRPRTITWEDQLADNFALRSVELKAGAKYTASEFKAYASGSIIKDSDSGKGWYVSLETPICKYGQAYDKDIVLEEAKTNFVNGYYNMYLADYERSQKSAEMDKE